MADSFLMSIGAVLAMVPLTIAALRPSERRTAMFWVLLAVAVAGPLLQVGLLLQAGWRTGLSPALWVTVTVSLVTFAALAAATSSAWRLAPILLPYLLTLGVLAVIWQNQPGRAMTGEAPSVWIQVHIALSVITYGLLTIAAVAGSAVFVQERALKAKTLGFVSGILPSMADSEDLQVRLLGASAVVLACGVVTGMSAQYLHAGRLLSLDHKTVLSLVTFGIICVLLFAHFRSGLRGRRAARVVLLAYLCLTLAYPGVKFVTDVVLG